MPKPIDDQTADVMSAAELRLALTGSEKPVRAKVALRQIIKRANTLLASAETDAAEAKSAASEALLGLAEELDAIERSGTFYARQMADLDRCRAILTENFEPLVKAHITNPISDRASANRAAMVLDSEFVHNLPLSMPDVVRFIDILVDECEKQGVGISEGLMNYRNRIAS